jgi:hypothetical protein
MGGIFYDLDNEELCDLICGEPEPIELWQSIGGLDMQKDIKLTNGTIIIVGYQSSIDIYFWKEGNNGEADSSFIIIADNCRDLTTDEIIEDFIANLEYAAVLTMDDKEKLRNELHSYINPISSDR